jgi:hypothetical protein
MGLALSSAMARGECQNEVAAAAAEDGIEFGPQSFPWICQRGHLALSDAASSARDALRKIFAELNGNEDELNAARTTRLSGDFVHEPTGTLVEVDEHQHFTSARLTTLRLYPADAELGFDLERYIALCKKWRSQADRAFAHRHAACFGVRGRQRQRAYYDALRDLATPAMEHPALIRIDAPVDNGRAAYKAHRDRLLELLT